MVTVGTEWVNSFHSPCDQHNLSHRDECARGFGSAMQSRGHNWKFDWGNNNAWESDWRDPSHGGHSNQWVDNVDFVYLATHGGAGNDYFLAAFATRNDKCLWNNRESRLGKYDCEWAVFDTCHSVQLPNPHHKWQHSFDGLHMVFGFTGTALDSWWTDDRGYDFGRKVGAGAKLSGAWLDEAYSYWCDDDPAVLACGRSESDARNRLYNERITSGYSDIRQEDIRWWYWRWRH